VKREGEQWYAILTCEYAFGLSLTFHPSEEAMGIDLGITCFAMLSDGTAIANPRYYRAAEAQLKAAHQKVARRTPRSRRRDRAKRQLSRLYRKVRHQRRDFLHQQSHQLVQHYGVLVFEDLQIANMSRAPEPKQDAETGKYLPNGAAAKGGLNKSILDAGWGQFVALCSRKAEEAGGTVVRVAPQETSQECSGCRKNVPKDLGERWHACPHCGLELDRDHNAAPTFCDAIKKAQGPEGSPRRMPVEASGFSRGVLHRYQDPTS
jgi:putative transposase